MRKLSILLAVLLYSISWAASASKVTPIVDRKAYYLDDSSSITVGNLGKANEFQAHVKMGFWGGEDSISLHEEGVKGKPTLKNEVITLDLAKRKLEWFEGSGNIGGVRTNSLLHWVEVLKEKPASNKWSLKISDGGQFNYYYQTKFTDKATNIPGSVLEYFERDGEDWVRLNYPTGRFIERPLDIDGSIAVYHKTKKNHRVGGKNYRTGKVLHIPRPTATDAKGKSVLCDIQVKDGIYTRTIPQQFLDSVAYPIIVNDTLGYTSIGGSPYGQADGQLCSYYIGDMPEAGTLDTIRIYDSDVSNLPNAYMGLYSGTGGVPSVRIVKSPELDLEEGAKWELYTASSEALGNGLEMYPAMVPKFDSDFRFQYDVAAGYWVGFESATYDIPSSPPTWDSTESNWKVSAYITYTPSAPAAAGQVIFVSTN